MKLNPDDYSIEKDMEKGLFETLPESDMGIICGADEAGRGPLAGPVTAAAVVLPQDFPISILNDSKKMSEKERMEAEVVIKEKAISWAIVSLSHSIIDRINILQASLMAMKMAYERVASETHVDTLLVDGNKKPDVAIPCSAIVKGDGKIPEIMAASILAKTERDRLMLLCDRKWPEYGYKEHKGYPTKQHIAMIEKYGPSPITRMSFHLKSKKEDETPSLF